MANYLDSQYLPGYKWDGEWDPEGLLSTLPAIVTGLMGIFAGLLLRNTQLGNAKRLAMLTLIGLACIGAGYGWHVAPTLDCPMIKKLWTPSFVLYAAGWSYILVAIFHLIIDIGKIDFWARPFVWIGMNPITLYMLNNMVGGFGKLVQRVIHDRWIESAGPQVGPFALAILSTLLTIAIAWVLYRNKAFIRV